MQGLQHLCSSVFKSYRHICVRSILHKTQRLLNAIRYYDTSQHTEFELWIEKRLQKRNVAVVIQWVVEVIEMTESGTVSAVIVIRAVAVIISHIVSDIADEPSDA